MNAVLLTFSFPFILVSYSYYVMNEADRSARRIRGRQHHSCSTASKPHAPRLGTDMSLCAKAIAAGVGLGLLYLLQLKKQRSASAPPVPGGNDAPPVLAVNDAAVGYLLDLYRNGCLDSEGERALQQAAASGNNAAAGYFVDLYRERCLDSEGERALQQGTRRIYAKKQGSSKR